MGEKRLLAILGSPHRQGSTAAMLDWAVQAAKEAGWQVDYVWLYEKDIGFCRGCRTCGRLGRCVREDDIRELEGLFKTCSRVALAAPVYWANVPGAVKNMMDRLVGTAMEETKTFPKKRFLPGQSYILLTACHTPFPFDRLFGQSSGALGAMREFFKTGGMKSGGSFVWAGARPGAELPKGLRRRIKRAFGI